MKQLYYWLFNICPQCKTRRKTYTFGKSKQYCNC
jgi:hypothetical protein